MTQTFVLQGFLQGWTSMTTNLNQHQEANTQTNVQGKPMKNIIRKNTAWKFNNKKVSYHIVSTQKL
jgi:hypothetical protein